MENEYAPYVVHVIDDKEFLKKHRNEIFTLVQNAYSDKGGFAGADNPRTLIKDTDRAKMVFDKNGKLIACALYYVDIGGFKRFGSAGISGNGMSLKAVEDIIQSDIEPYDNWYWVEASGAIEYLFKKNNGNPIPNWIVKDLLELNEDTPAGFRIDESDNVHYFRNIGGREQRKMMFGFKDNEARNLAYSSVADYGEFKLGVNGMDRRISESTDKIHQEIEEARKFIRRLFDLHYEDGFNEMLPEWRERLLHSIDTINDNMDKIPEDKQRMYMASLDRAETCLEDMTVIKFKKIEVRR